MEDRLTPFLFNVLSEFLKSQSFDMPKLIGNHPYVINILGSLGIHIGMVQ